MGMMDVLKRWMGGEKKPEPARRAPQVRVPVAKTAAPNQPPAAAAPAQPAPMTAAEAMDVLAAKASPKAAAVAAPTPSANERREKPRVNAREGTTVLVIDDSPTIVALLKRMLEQNGYNAMEASDAESGVTLALAEEPDLIFLDIVLPGMNGFEALRRLRRDPITKTTPIIMISGNELATEQFYAQRIGADDFMKKPFSRSEVFARIEKLLDEHKVIRKHVVPSGAGVTAPAATAAAAATATASTLPASTIATPLPTAAAPVPASTEAQKPAAVAPATPVVATPVVAASSKPVAPKTAVASTSASIEAPKPADIATQPPAVAVTNTIPTKPPAAPAQRPTTH